LYSRVKKGKEEKKNKGPKEKRKRRETKRLCEGSLLPFYKKIPCPTQVWGRCNEEETVGRKKEKKENRAKSKGTNEETQDKKQKKTNGWARDRQTCGTFTPALLWLLIIYL
jgi:hypothetical protein